jgi:hypothetical protein
VAQRFSAAIRASFSSAALAAEATDSTFPAACQIFRIDRVEMNPPRDRELIEGRFGPLGSGAQSLAIRGVTYSLSQLLSQIGADFDDSKPIDVLALADGHYALRYIDGQDLRVVAAEFDADFRLLGELRASLTEWEGDGSTLAYYSGH